MELRFPLGKRKLEKTPSASQFSNRSIGSWLARRGSADGGRPTPAAAGGLAGAAEDGGEVAALLYGGDHAGTDGDGPRR